MTDLIANIQVERPSLPAILVNPPSTLLLVEDADTMEHATQYLVTVKTKFKELDAQREQIKSGALQTCRAIDAFFKPVLDYFRSEESTTKALISQYVLAEQQKAREAQAAADKQAEAERAKLEAKAEKLEAKGKAGAAEELRAEASVVSAAVAPAAVKAKGQRSTWSVTITDNQAALESIVEHYDEYAHIVKIDLGALKKLVTAMAGRCPIKGVLVKEDVVIAVSTTKTTETF